jgi:putative ABC transport system substrate-binding protein
MHELVPAATSMAYLVNPSNPIVTENETREMQVAARTIGIHLRIVHAKDPTEFNVAIETAVREGAGGLVVGSDVLFLSHPEELATLAARHRLPSVYRDRRAAVVGGLLSYGTDLIEARRQVGVYVGRILNGEKTADLPVQQVTKTQFVINIKAAKMLGIEISPTLLIRADEVIE